MLRDAGANSVAAAVPPGAEFSLEGKTRMLRSLALVGSALIGLAFATQAEASYTTGAVNLRAGPGTGYGVITTAPPGAWVSVRNCAGSWCNVNYRGINGWMSAGYIGGGRSHNTTPPGRITRLRLRRPTTIRDHIRTLPTLWWSALRFLVRLWRKPLVRGQVRLRPLLRPRDAAALDPRVKDAAASAFRARSTGRRPEIPIAAGEDVRERASPTINRDRP